MRFLNASRARRLAGALVILASSGAFVVSTQEAGAQRRDVYWERCDQATWAVRRSRPIDIADRWESVTRARGELRNPNSEPATLASAERECTQSLTRENRYAVPAYMCAGDANLEARNPSASAQDAYCAYNAAATLAARARNPSAESAAHVGRARSLEGLGASQDEVLEAYGRAIQVGGNSATEARIAAARHYIRRNEFDRARGYLFANGNPVGSGTEVALAIVELARMNNASDRLGLLRSAEAVSPRGPDGYSTSVAVNSAVGAAYYEAQESERAYGYFRHVTEGQNAEPGYQNLQDEAFLYASMLALTDPRYGGSTEALRLVGRAGNTPAALRQGCLVRLMIGGPEVYREVVDRNGRPMEGTTWSIPGLEHCTRLGSTAEGDLLRGMFFLRFAQHLPSVPPNRSTWQRGQWDSAVSQAIQAFRNGQSKLAGVRTELQWPASRGASQPTLNEMLEFGLDLASYYDTVCSRASYVRLEGRPGPFGVFATYKTVGGPGWRCGRL